MVNSSDRVLESRSPSHHVTNSPTAAPCPTDQILRKEGKNDRRLENRSMNWRDKESFESTFLSVLYRGWSISRTLLSYSIVYIL